MGANGTEEGIPKNRSSTPLTKLSFQNNCFSIQKMTLQKIKNLRKNFQVVTSYCR